jgi:hypothetical protein
MNFLNPQGRASDIYEASQRRAEASLRAVDEVIPLHKGHYSFNTTPKGFIAIRHKYTLLQKAIFSY